MQTKRWYGDENSNTIKQQKKGLYDTMNGWRIDPSLYRTADIRSSKQVKSGKLSTSLVDKFYLTWIERKTPFDIIQVGPGKSLTLRKFRTQVKTKSSTLSHRFHRFTQILGLDLKSRRFRRWRRWLVMIEDDKKGSIHPFVEVYRPLEQPQSMGW